MIECKIIDYLTLEVMKDKNFHPNPNIRIRSAYLIAKEQYRKMSNKDKELIIKKIKNQGLDESEFC